MYCNSIKKPFWEVFTLLTGCKNCHPPLLPLNCTTIHCPFQLQCNACTETHYATISTVVKLQCIALICDMLHCTWKHQKPPTCMYNVHCMLSNVHHIMCVHACINLCTFCSIILWCIILHFLCILVYSRVACRSESNWVWLRRSELTRCHIPSFHLGGW